MFATQEDRMDDLVQQGVYTMDTSGEMRGKSPDI